MFDSRLPCSSSSGDALRVSDLETYAKEWLLDGETAQHSKDALANRRLIVRNFLWFLKREGCETVTVYELKRFFRYFHNAHEEAGGRRGNPQEKTPVKPSTVASYHRYIRTFFRWLVAKGCLPDSPVEKMSVPFDRPGEIRPFTVFLRRFVLTQTHKLAIGVAEGAQDLADRLDDAVLVVLKREGRFDFLQGDASGQSALPASVSGQEPAHGVPPTMPAKRSLRGRLAFPLKSSPLA